MSKRPRPDVENDDKSSGDNNEKNAPCSSATVGTCSRDSSTNTVNYSPLLPSSPAKFTRLSEEPSSLTPPSSSSNINTTITTNPTNRNLITDASVNHGNGSYGNASGSAILLTCNLPNCPTSTRQFLNSEEYEVHYTQAHMNRCMECLRNFPSLKILECHIKENHDMLSKVKREKGEKIYECFIEDCDKVCATPQKRRLHLIDKHYYPKDFNFYIVNSGIDRVSSLLRSPPTRNTKTRIRSPSDAAASSFSLSNIRTTTMTTPDSSAINREQDVFMNDSNTMTVVKNDDDNGGNEKEEEEGSKKQLQRTDKMALVTKKKNNKSFKNAGGGNGDQNEARHGRQQEQQGSSQDSMVSRSGRYVDKKEEDSASVAEVPDEIMSDLTSKMSAVQMVPPSVRFGRRGGGAGFGRK